MKREKLYLFQAFLVAQINNLAIYPLIMVILTISDSLFLHMRPGILLWMIFGLVPFSLYLMRYYLPRFIPFVAAHIGIVAFIFGVTFFAGKYPLGMLQCFQSPVNRVLFVLVTLFLRMVVSM